MSMGVELTINDGKPVVDVTDMVYEPGGTYQSEFPIANLGTFDVWYRVYFTNVDGELKDDITVTIKEKDGTVLCKGTMNQLTADKVMTGSLAAGESKTLTPNVEIYTYWGTSSQSERDFANGLYYLDCEETDPAALVVTPTQTEPTNAAETTPTTETTETEASSPEVVE